jgi:hypothetical protein
MTFSGILTHFYGDTMKVRVRHVGTVNEIEFWTTVRTNITKNLQIFMQNRSNPVSGLDTDRQALDVDLDPDPVEKCQFDKIKLHKTNVADPGPF